MNDPICIFRIRRPNGQMICAWDFFERNIQKNYPQIKTSDGRRWIEKFKYGGFGSKWIEPPWVLEWGPAGGPWKVYDWENAFYLNVSTVDTPFGTVTIRKEVTQWANTT